MTCDCPHCWPVPVYLTDGEPALERYLAPTWPRYYLPHPTETP